MIGLIIAFAVGLVLSISLTPLFIRYLVHNHYGQFIRQDGRMVIEDQGSLNGTYVNRTLVDGSAVLRDGDEVQIGKFRMTYHTGGTASGTSGAGRV